MQFTFWYWFVLSAVFVSIELIAPAEFFLWIGMAAAVNGGVVWLWPEMSWVAQFVSFAALSVLSLYIWHKLYRNPKSHEQSVSDHRGAQYIGRTFTLTEPITDGIGKIKVDDTTWRILGDDCESGKKVKVTGIEGVNLTVELVE